nr:MAG TPA: tail protein [Caudoviricetes sp.]
MYTMVYDIQVGSYQLAMLDKVEIHSSVELLADTAKITLPAAEYNKALDVEQELRRGDAVTIRLGYAETGLVTEFVGYLQRIATDNGDLTLTCEDDLFLLRKPLRDTVLTKISLSSLLAHIIKEMGISIKVDCSYSWVYDKFVVKAATGYDVLKKIQEECGADVYLREGVLHLHPPGEVIGTERIYDFAYNIEEANLTYRRAEDKKYLIAVKALLPNGKVREFEVGTPGGDKITVKCPTSDEASMRLRAETELRRRTFDGYDGSIETWLVPECVAGDTVELHDADYPHKEGVYFVRSVTTEFSSSGGKRKIELGFRLS